ncbi:MAG TPA: hypothetical protein VGC69_15005 [Bordetella sp.]
MIKIARLLAILAAAAALGVWGAILFAPRPDAPPPALGTAGVPHADVAPVALLFGRDAVLDTTVVVQGLIADGQHSAAVVSINGAAPTAVTAGLHTASGVVVRAIDGQGITLDVAGSSAHAPAPARGETPAGFVAVP